MAQLLPDWQERIQGADLTRRGAAWNDVITSYSIHYTKLYELASLRQSSPLFTLGTGAEVMKRVDFRNVGVITSYSIHYTKLYDVCLALTHTVKSHWQLKWQKRLIRFWAF